MRSLLLLILTMTAGCMASGTGLVKKQAAFDLSCSEDQINVVQLTGMNDRGTGATFGAIGCGKKASYIRANANGVLMNGPVQSAQ